MPKKDYSRTERIGDLIQKELSLIFQKEAKDPRFDMVTISAVDVSPNLSQAKIYIVSYKINDPDQKVKLIKSLNKASGFFRTLLASRIDIRTTPQLNFIYDESIERGTK